MWLKSYTTNVHETTMTCITCNNVVLNFKHVTVAVECTFAIQSERSFSRNICKTDGAEQMLLIVSNKRSYPCDILYVLILGCHDRYLTQDLTLDIACLPKVSSKFRVESRVKWCICDNHFAKPYIQLCCASVCMAYVWEG